ncbi:MAG TPA: hypothetical protein VGZ26_05695, partial [Pirellulales bacterium]|nr:hypothetical protein [Pirellulales bacterium]
KLFTQGQGLKGLDRNRPWGVTLTTDGLSLQPLIFLPVDNLKELLDALSGLIGDAQDSGNGVFEINVFGQKLFVKETKTKWAFVSMSPEAIADVPKDPAKLLGGLDKDYDVALRLNVQNIPELYRSLAVDQLRLGVESGLDRTPNESDADFAARKKMVDGQIKALTTAINEIDQLTLGWALDTSAKTTHIDLSIAAVAGSDFSKQLSQVKETTSEFAGFLVPDAAASLNFSAKMAKDNTEQIVAALQTLRSHAQQHIEADEKLSDDATKKIAKEMVSEVFDAIQATIESGKIDAGATLNLSDKSMALVVGAYVANPNSLEDALKKFAKLAEKEPDFPGIKFDADKHGGVRFHTASLPVPKEEGISRVLGDKLDVAVGIGAKSAYLALGTDSLKLCQQLIDKSKADASKRVPPFQLNVSLTPIFQFAAAMQDRPEVTMMAEELAKSKGKDHVRIVVTPQPNAVTFSINAEEGVIRLLAQAGRAATAGGLPGGQ